MSARFSLIVANSLLVLALAGALAMAFYVAPDVERRFFPVITDQKITVTRNGLLVRFEIVITKHRACDFDGVWWQAVDTSNPPSRVPISVINASTGLPSNQQITYPPGVFRTGPFEAFLPAYFAGAGELIGEIQYRCHPFWLTRATYGPVPVPPPEPR